MGECPFWVVFDALYLGGKDKDGVYSEGSAISSRFHSGREGRAVKSLAERGSRSNDRAGVDRAGV